MKLPPRKEPMHFIVAELAPDRWFTIAGHKHERWSPDVGTPNIRTAMNWGPFASAGKVMRDIEIICTAHGKRKPRISRIVLCSAIMIRTLHEVTTCTLHEPSSLESLGDRIGSLSTRLSQVESILSQVTKTSHSSSAAIPPRTTSKRISRKPRTK